MSNLVSGIDWNNPQPGQSCEFMDGLTFFTDCGCRSIYVIRQIKVALKTQAQEPGQTNKP